MRLYDSLFRPALCLVAASLGVLAGERNLVVNGSFEKRSGDVPTAWQWSAGAAKAVLTIDRSEAHSGSRALKLTNPTPRAPHVYGTLWQTVRVKADTVYTLSCWVKSAKTGMAWIGGGKKWRRRFAFPASTEGWKRVTGTFRTGNEERSFTVRILTESPTDGLWVDDVQLEEGDKATPFVYVPPLKPGELRLTLAPFHPGGNLVPNPSFEVIHGVRPQGWMWDERNTDAEMIIEDGTAHTGKHAIKFTNGTAFAPQVYGWFGAIGGIPVKPSTIYTISAWVRAEDPGLAWFGGGRGWRIRCRIPATRGKWKKVTRTFSTDEKESIFPLMVVTESPTPGVWIDDLCLREGCGDLPLDWNPEKPTNTAAIGPLPPKIVIVRGHAVSTRWAADRYPPDKILFCGNTLEARGVIALADPEISGRCHLEIRRPDGSIAAAAAAPFPGGSLAYDVQARTNISNLAVNRVSLEIRAIGKAGNILTAAKRDIRIVTPKHIRARLQEAEALRRELDAAIGKLQSRGQADYPLVTLTILEHFIPWSEKDVRTGILDRAWTVANELVTMAEAALQRARAALNGSASYPPVPRYVTSRLEIDGPSFIGERQYPDGKQERGPIFFTGYGHFHQVRHDIEEFPGYGCNLIQIEFGPRSVLPDGWTPRDDAIKAFLAVCDRAAAANVSVNLLLSPHYFPAWALKKWPYLKECSGGFFRYCVHDPNARKVLETSLRYVIPRLRNHPALHSLCLSNEPISTDLRGCRVAAKRWPEWLQNRHKSIGELNRCWGTDYKKFTDIAIPAPKFQPGPETYDFVLFNQELFAEFHAWMAKIIHEMAPEIPVHAKIMMGAHFKRNLGGIWSVSPELFGQLSDINGNDCISWYHRKGEWSNGWQMEQMAYDFQRSVADKPVFNSENHVIVDRDHNTISPEHIYSTLWQGALHGQSATTIWVWERTNDHASSLAGSILHRPRCVEAVGRCNLDLTRLAHPMTTLQRQLPQIVFVWSLASIIQGNRHYRALAAAYRAANFLGVPLGFITERQLERLRPNTPRPRVLREAKVIVCAEVTHLPRVCAEALAGLEQRGLPVAVLGEAPKLDEYGRPYEKPAALPAPTLLPWNDDPALFAWFTAQAKVWRLQRPALVTSADGLPAYGIECRSAATTDGTLAAICNHRRESSTVRLTPNGRPVAAVNLIDGRAVGPEIQADPMGPMLLHIPK